MDTNTDLSGLQLSTRSTASSLRLIGSQIAFATVGMFSWDILINLGSEYRLVLRRKFGFLTFVYFWARLATLGFLVAAVIFFTVPFGRHCSTVATAILSVLPTFITAEGIVLFYRLRAVYLGQNSVITTFFLLLLVVIGFSALIPIAGNAFPASSTDAYCDVSVNVRLAEALVVIPLIYTALVFFAVSYRLMPLSLDMQASDNGKPFIRRFKAFWRSTDLPTLSRTLVQDGQVYILIFLLTTLVTVIPMTVNNVPVVYKFIFIAPHIAIENSMNSYMFRSLRATLLQPNLNVADSTLHFSSGTDGEDTQVNGDAQEMV